MECLTELQSRYDRGMPALTRPGGRTAAVRDAVLRAAADLLVESGLEGVELTAVAQRAGVGKSTVYRRWGSVPALVSDLLTDMADTSSARPSTGSLHTDLLAAAKLIRRTLTDVRQGPLFKAIIAAATCDPITAQALAGFVTAVALIKPSKSLADVDLPSVKKRLKEKSFARGVHREDVYNGAEEIGLPLDEHIENVIKALQAAAGELGL